MAPPARVEGDGHRRPPRRPSAPSSQAPAATSRGLHLGVGGFTRSPPVCKFWLQGRCVRQPCRFLHGDGGDRPPPPFLRPFKKVVERRSVVWKNPAVSLAPAPPAPLVLSLDNGKNGNDPCGHQEAEEDSPQPSPPATDVIDDLEGGSHGASYGCRSTFSTEEHSLPSSPGHDKNDPCSDQEAVEDPPQPFPPATVRDDNDDLGPQPSPPATDLEGRSYGHESSTLSNEAHSLLPSSPDHAKNGNDSCVHQEAVEYPPQPSPPGAIADGNDDLEGGSYGASREIVCRTGWFSWPPLTAGIGIGSYAKSVTGIALPSGCSKLFTGHVDGRICVLDCISRRCIETISLQNSISCLITQGCWVFAGVRCAIKCFNIRTGHGLTLPGPAGLVCSMVTSDELLFAGIDDGSIFTWKVVPDDTGREESSCFWPANIMRGHASAITSLAVGHGRLYSGYMDGTIGVWRLDTLQCAYRVCSHTNAVTSLFCWDEVLLSCSLDGDITVWASIAEEKGGDLKAVYTHREEHGIAVMSGMLDSKGRPAVVCSLVDGTIKMYELPSFKNKAVISWVAPIWAIHPSTSGIFFTGDASGDIKVWRCGRQG